LKDEVKKPKGKAPIPNDIWNPPSNPKPPNPPPFTTFMTDLQKETIDVKKKKYPSF
jgi:hypothetical protein